MTPCECGHPYHLGGSCHYQCGCIAYTPRPTIHELFEQADQNLFDAGVAALHMKTKKDREYVDKLITDARIKLETARRRLPRHLT